MSVMETPKRGRGRLLWGCAGGCVTFLIVLALFAWAVKWWMMRPLPTVEPDTFTGPATRGVLLVRAGPGDEMMLAVLSALAETDAAHRALAPGSTREDQTMSPAGVEAVSPVQIVGVLGLPDAPEGSAGLAISLGSGGRAFVQSTGGQYSGAYGRPEDTDAGPSIYGPDGGPYAVMQHRTNTVMLVDGRDAARQWARRFATRWSRLQQDDEQDAPPPPEDWGLPPEVQRELDRLDADAPVRAAVVGADAVADVSSQIAVKAGQDRGELVRRALAGVTALSAELMQRDESSGILTVHVTTPDPEGTGPALQAALKALGAAVRVREQQQDGVTLEAILPELPRNAAAALDALAGD